GSPRLRGVRALRPLSALLALLAAFALAACGGEEQAAPPAEPAAAKPADFPAAANQTLAELTKGLPEGPILAPSTSQVLVGANRDTRIPVARDLLTTDFADVVGKEPVVLIFSTPALCASRVCGPVTDIVEQVRAEAGSGVAFVHQEIYRNNKVDDGVRPQVA